MNTVEKFLLTVLGLAVLFGAGWYFLNPTQHKVGYAPDGIASNIATTSIAAVSTTASTVFATSSCSARFISTSASPIMITFSDVQGSVPTGSFGFIQPASTTVAYDATQFGCGAYKVYSFTAGNITVSESR